MRFNVVRDTTWLEGEFVKNYEKGGKFLADIDCWVENKKVKLKCLGRPP
jgi:hypothetical protein